MEPQRADLFSITPPEKCTLVPGDHCEVTVHFQAPAQPATNLYQSLLFLFVEPNGHNYEVSLTAQILRPQPTVSALLSNRHYVGFGGLPLGQSTSNSPPVKGTSAQPALWTVTPKQLTLAVAPWSITRHGRPVF